MQVKLLSWYNKSLSFDGEVSIGKLDIKDQVGHGWQNLFASIIREEAVTVSADQSSTLKLAESLLFETVEILLRNVHER